MPEWGQIGGCMNPAGLLLGLVFGIAIDNIGLGLILGVLFSIALGDGPSSRSRRR